MTFANTWGIDHLGRPGQPGFGLLREATHFNMNSVLRLAIEMFPDWYRPFPEKNIGRRIVASSSLSLYRLTGDEKYLDDPARRAYSHRFLRHILSVGLHTLIRATGAGTMLKRFQEFLRHR